MAREGDFYRWNENVDRPYFTNSIFQCGNLFKVTHIDLFREVLTLQAVSFVYKPGDVILKDYECFERVGFSFLNYFLTSETIPPVINRNPDFNRFDIDI